jgi:Ca-activated chloride channel family protein
MNTSTKYLIVALLLVLCVTIPAFGRQAFGQQFEKAPDDRTLSPYFFVNSDAPDVDTLPLKSTRADVDIAGVIARVHVTQVYENTGRRPIEAIYVFPGSTRAAVFGMKMTIGERVIEATIEERQKARAAYEAARAAGQSASLLEQQRPNVFQMNVANIMPGDVIKVELDYTELLVPEGGMYEFVYPTVVGPRYSTTPSAGAPDTETWVANPYLHEGDAEPFTFDIDVTLNSGIPIAKIACDSHKTDVEYEGKTTASISLADTKGAGTKDFILRYGLAGGKVQSGILLYPGEDENFFLVMMEPPARVGEADIPPREYIFVLDVSGSMHGFPLNTAKKLMRDLASNLKPTDTFNVVLFAGRAAVMSPQSLPATSANIEKAMNTIDSQSGGGGTRLINALTTAFALPRAEEGVARTTVIVTDGYVSCEPQTFDLIRQNLNNSNVFTFGIGSSVNRHLIEGMARSGLGEPLIVTSPDEAATKAGKFREYIRKPVLTRIEVDFESFNAYDVEPISVPDVLADRPVIVFGKYKGTPRGKVSISGFSGDGEYTMKLDIAPDMEDESNTALRYLWARHRIRTLVDYNNLRQDSERVREVTNLGLTYNLLTEYTSFVAIDSLVRNKGGEQETIKQPLPLPDGVSDLAVGGSIGKARFAKNARLKVSQKAAVRSMNQAPMPSAAPVASEERDSFSIGRLLSGLAGARSNVASPVPPSVPATLPVSAIHEEEPLKVARKMKVDMPAIHGSTPTSGPKDSDTLMGDKAAYVPKGEFKSDDSRVISEVVGADERVDREEAIDGKPAMRIEPEPDEGTPSSSTSPLVLLLIVMTAATTGLVIWRSRSGRRKEEDTK